MLQGAAHDTGLEPAEVRLMLATVLEGTCSPTALARLGEVVGGSREGADAILKRLEAAHLMWRLYNAEGSRRGPGRIDAAHPKLYLMDPLLMIAAVDRPPAWRDKMFETVVGMHLGRALSPQAVPFFEPLRFDLVGQDGEVDFLPADPSIPAMEVKSGAPGDAHVLLCARHGSGIVVTDSHFELREDGIWYVPAAYLVAMLALRS